MAVLIVAEVQGQTREGYDRMVAAMGDVILKVPGRLLHAAHPTDDGGWRVIEVWESREVANRWFAAFVAPNLPPGVKPRRTFRDLHFAV